MFSRKWWTERLGSIGISLSMLLLVLLMGWPMSAAAFCLFCAPFPPEMVQARYSSKDMIGDLGGMEVRIPRDYARYVEYDADPGFGEKREGPAPKRTYASRLRAFGMYVRFPDMKGLVDAAAREERRKLSLVKDSPWIHVGIHAGEDYPSSGDHYLDGRLASITKKPADYWWDDYERLPGTVYGLEAYRVKGIDPVADKYSRKRSFAKDVYVHLDKVGHVDTYISCEDANSPRGVGVCDLGFTLAPKAQVAVQISFHKALLPKWQKIKESVRNLLLSFEVKKADVGNVSR
jgi:hypothetical protein